METVEYRNKQIELEESSNPKLSIDQQPVQVSYDVSANEFNTAELPYRTFDSLQALAEAVVDQRLQDE